jgi:hypothetical protein
MQWDAVGCSGMQWDAVVAVVAVVAVLSLRWYFALSLRLWFQYF